LSNDEKVPPDQWCYEPNAKGEYAEGMKLKPNYRELSGYRLPWEAEWEYACRAGTGTAWSHGSDGSLLGHYAWYTVNADSVMHPVGGLKPNSLGLFDAGGNAWQRCNDTYDTKTENESLDTNNNIGRVIRGGSFFFGARHARSANRTQSSPAFRSPFIGFRVARTITH
jgi:formylglycine-generating enzyme required for sulfatase activity